MAATLRFFLTLPPYGSLNFEPAIKNEIENLLKKRPGEDSEFYKAYKRANQAAILGQRQECRGRGGRLKKITYARNLIANMIRMETGRSFESCFKEAADRFCDEVVDDSKGDLSTLYKYRKKRVRFPCPEIDKSWDAGDRIEKIDQELQRTIKILPPQYVANTIREDPGAVDELKHQDRLIRRIFKVLLESPGISQRGLCRRLNVTLAELRPILRLLKMDHVINWDPKKAILQLIGRQKSDKRKFVWLADSSDPQWGPYLEKGKVYARNLFRNDIVDQWIHDRAALLIP